MKIIIDNIHFNVETGKNLLEACIGLGLDLPYFCYHPAMGSVGACRQCAVKKFTGPDDKKGKIIMACMEPVAEGMFISINDKEARDFRAGIIEGLMLNHPHDCPVCDEGGECHLQDMTYMTGHNYRRYEFKKRTYISQYLGPFIHHEMNRCIQCYRCVRFYRDYAGGKDLNVYGSASQLYFGRKEEGILESEFSGNLVEVCPTGVFTDKTLQKHYTRKWDLTNSPSICIHCSVGCNTMAGERYGQVRRILNRYHGDINGYFLCDRGRFGYEFLHHPTRIKNIIINSPDSAYTTTDSLQSLLPELSPALKKGRIAGIGSPRASLESNFALMSLTGNDRFFSGISQKEHRMTLKALALMKKANIRAVTLKQIENCDAALILNDDLTQTAPVMALSVRQMARSKARRIAEKSGIPPWNDSPARELTQDVKSPVYIAHPYKTNLDDIASGTLHRAPSDIARLGFAIAAAIDNKAPAVTGLDEEMKNLAGRIAKDLLNAENPLIISGLTANDDPVIDALTNIAEALSSINKKPSVAIAFPESNSAGLATFNGDPLEKALELINSDPPEILVILENDLYQRIEAEKADLIFQKCRKVIVIDHLMNKTSKKAHVVLPAAPWVQSSGTIVNHEGRAQRYYPVLPIDEPVAESWRWLMELIKLTGTNKYGWNRFDDVVNAMTENIPELSGIKKLPDSRFRVQNEKVARQTMRFSGRTAITADIEVSEPKPPEDKDNPLKFSMEGFKGRPPASLIPYYWSPGWNSAQAVNKYLDKPNGSNIDGDPGIELFTDKSSEFEGYSRSFPEEFRPLADKLMLIPVPQIFGTEELSARGEAIMSLVPPAFVILNAREARKLNAASMDMLEADTGSRRFSVTLRIDNSIPDGIAGLGLLPEYGFVDFQAATKLAKKDSKT